MGDVAQVIFLLLNFILGLPVQPLTRFPDFALFQFFLLYPWIPLSMGLSSIEYASLPDYALLNFHFSQYHPPSDSFILSASLLLIIQNPSSFVDTDKAVVRV